MYEQRFDGSNTGRDENQLVDEKDLPNPKIAEGDDQLEEDEEEAG